MPESQLHEIEEFIEENDVKEFVYHTWRFLGEDEQGEIRVLVWEEGDPARAEYTCPECGHHEYLEKEWKRPFSVECGECGERLKIPRIKDKIKRERKKRTRED